jgi:predicted lipoprotein with Yx(FWY)xxD motif
MRPVTRGVSTYDGSKQEEDMRHPKIKITAIAIASAAGVSGIVAAAAAEMSGSAMTPAASSIAVVVPATAPATIHTQSAMVGGKTDTVLVDAQGLPLYYYRLDTPTKSFVSGALASFWPPLVSSSPTITGASGNLSVSHDANGTQVAYNGHFLYTFADDSAGQVSGQGVEGFSVATPGLGASGTPSSAPAPAPTSAPTLARPWVGATEARWLSPSGR